MNRGFWHSSKNAAGLAAASHLVSNKNEICSFFFLAEKSLTAVFDLVMIGWTLRAWSHVWCFGPSPYKGQLLLVLRLACHSLRQFHRSPRVPFFALVPCCTTTTPYGKYYPSNSGLQPYIPYYLYCTSACSPDRPLHLVSLLPCNGFIFPASPCS